MARTELHEDGCDTFPHIISKQMLSHGALLTRERGLDQYCDTTFQKESQEYFCLNAIMINTICVLLGAGSIPV